ncbi:MAG: glycosyltransferase family 39 protein [Oligoflexia bacterium]|nr:glycosyltransferase family 39 protein [Oligoflexia bacterium]
MSHSYQDFQKNSPISMTAICILGACIVFICFAPLDYCKLIKPDEGRYAIIAREMVVTKDWIVPRLNGLLYFEKPPLHYWMTAISFSLFGENEWSARLWSAIAGMSGVLMLFFAASRLFGREVALYSALILVSSIFYLSLSRINTVDMGLSLFMEIALMSMLLAQRDSATPKENRWWSYLMWVGLALAVLTKGPMGIILPAGIFICYLPFSKKFSHALTLIKKIHLGVGTLIFLAITAPWFIAISLRHPAFLKFFFVREHIERFLTNAHNRDEVWWYLVPFLFFGFLPWTTFFLSLIQRKIRNEIFIGTNTHTSASNSTRFKPNLLLIIWSIFIFCFFSFSSSKLPTYVLPIYPALALLLGQVITKLTHRQFFYQILIISIIALIALIFSPQIANYPARHTPQILYYNWSWWVIVAGSIWFCGSIGALIFARYNKRLFSTITMTLSFLLATHLAISGYEELAPSFSSAYAATKILPYLSKKSTNNNSPNFYAVKTYDHTLPFYIKQRLILVNHTDEMEFGIVQEPEKWIETMEVFVQRWKQEPGALALMTKGTYNELKKASLPMKLIFEDSRRTIVLSPLN